MILVFKMSEEEDNKKLEEFRKQKQEAYTKFKGFLEGIRTTKLNSTEQGFLQLLELVIDGFRNVQDDMIPHNYTHLSVSQRLKSWEVESNKSKKL